MLSTPKHPPPTSEVFEQTFSGLSWLQLFHNLKAALVVIIGHLVAAEQIAIINPADMEQNENSYRLSVHLVKMLCSKCEIAQKHVF